MKEGGEVWSTLVAKFGNVNKGGKYLFAICTT